MRFVEPIEEGRFLKRYKRFFAEVRFGDELVVAHVPNTGSLKSCLHAEARCRLTRSSDPSRKLPYTLQMLETETGWVGVNTGLSNRLVMEAFDQAKPAHWKAFDRIQGEFKINAESRLDFVMWKSADCALNKLPHRELPNCPLHFVEVKNVTLKVGDQAQFPDAVTARGQKHLEEMRHLIRQGHSAEILFTVQREDCQSFAPADSIDTEYGRLLRLAQKEGLRISAYPCRLSLTEIYLDTQNPLSVKL